MDELLVLMDNGCKYLDKSNSISDNAQEMLLLYKEEFPFTIVDTIDGQCLIWNQEFIDKVLVAMTTGDLSSMSDIERQVWYSFVEFQDEMSNSAPQTYIGAIGCTVPDINGDSFIVTSAGITTEKCLEPEATVPKERQSKSLDSYIMNLYNCEEVNNCGIIVGDVVDISPCPII
jgi:hypothetical protein